MVNGFYNRRFILCWLALCALLVQAAVPAGFMPARGAGGGVEIVICTSAGAQTVTLDSGHAPLDNPDAHDDGNACPYAPVLAQDAPAPAQAVAVVAFADAGDFARDAAAFAGTAAKPWQAQAPPLS